MGNNIIKKFELFENKANERMITEGGFVRMIPIWRVPPAAKKLAKKIISEMKSDINPFIDLIEDCKKEGIGFLESPDPRPALIKFREAIIDAFPEYKDEIKKEYYVKRYMLGRDDGISYTWSIFMAIYGTFVPRDDSRLNYGVSSNLIF